MVPEATPAVKIWAAVVNTSLVAAAALTVTTGLVVIRVSVPPLFFVCVVKVAELAELWTVGLAYVSTKVELQVPLKLIVMRLPTTELIVAVAPPVVDVMVTWPAPAEVIGAVH